MTGWDRDPDPTTGSAPDQPGADRPGSDSAAGRAGADGSGREQETVEWSTGLHDPAAVGDPGDWIDGADPAYWSDDDVTADPFPRALDLDVHPTDGGPWVDPALLGGPDAFAGDPSGQGLVSPPDPPEALRFDLAAADGNPGASWDALRDSDDPAVRALATHWTP